MRCKPNSHPANSIRNAYSRYEYVRANTIGVVTASPYWLKFAALSRLGTPWRFRPLSRQL
ncbi:MAG: hypothetical protein ACK55Z_21110 [bacterium]